MSRIKIGNLEDLTRLLKTPTVKQMETVKTLPKFHRNKYRAVRTEYRGRMYDSKSEAAYAEWLDEQQLVGKICWWQPKPGSFHLGCPENVYRPDFKVVVPVNGAVYTENGLTKIPERTFYDDVKGRETAKFRKDRKLWAAYGPCSLRIVTLDLRYPSGELKLESKPKIVRINYEVIDPK